MEPFILREGPVAVRPLRPQDAPLLLTWMQNPQVLAFYGGRDMAYTPEKIQEDFYAPEEGARRCLVEFEGAPVGYIQIYQLDAQLCQEYHYPYQPGELLFGIDQFIGEPALWGKQIGRRFLALVLRRLTQEEGAAAVILDPHANNPRALRCYEACGFRKVKFLPQHELHEGVWEDCWLMEYRPGAPPVKGKARCHRSRPCFFLGDAYAKRAFSVTQPRSGGSATPSPRDATPTK